MKMEEQSSPNLCGQQGWAGQESSPDRGSPGLQLQAQNPIPAPAIIAEVLISILMHTIGGNDGK